MREILQWSSNVGAVKIGMKMGKEKLLKWMDAFGFGEPTGLDFPGEGGGIVPPAEQWSGTSIVNIPMGQGIAVTPMQMAVGLLDGRQQRRAGDAAARGPGGRRRLGDEAESTASSRPRWRARCAPC